MKLEMKGPNERATFQEGKSLAEVYAVPVTQVAKFISFWIDSLITNITQYSIPFYLKYLENEIKIIDLM